MKGWLIVNRFLNNGKFSELYDWLITAAKRAGSELSLITNADIIVRADTQEIVYPDLCTARPDYVIFWDKDIRLARALEANGLRLYNRADAIEACDDKALT
ncbi:MAG: RimK family alpha-L-glutamate ligase, partial [Lachnospiraceae bacterium]|nr:RimK family alpha-L-glutamate ligase [Lachnospiraceae bacterium]